MEAKDLTTRNRCVKVIAGVKPKKNILKNLIKVNLPSRWLSTAQLMAMEIQTVCFCCIFKNVFRQNNSKLFAEIDKYKTYFFFHFLSIFAILFLTNVI